MMTVSGLLGGPTLESYLLARHRTIDALLERAIEEEGVTQVVEIACGLSPRGLRFKRRHGEQLTYIEADLPGMAARKEAALRRMGALSETHRVVVLDALKEQGPNSLRELAGTLKPDRGLVVITEGLLGYLEMGLVQGIWGRVAETLAGFRGGPVHGGHPAQRRGGPVGAGVPGSAVDVRAGSGTHALRGPGRRRCRRLSGQASKRRRSGGRWTWRRPTACGRPPARAWPTWSTPADGDHPPPRPRIPREGAGRSYGFRAPERDLPYVCDGRNRHGRSSVSPLRTRRLVVCWRGAGVMQLADVVAGLVGAMARVISEGHRNRVLQSELAMCEPCDFCLAKLGLGLGIRVAVWERNWALGV